MLVRMPVQVWSMLPEPSATLFVGFTTTDNQAVGLQRQVEERLVSTSGSANQRPHPLPAHSRRNYADTSGNWSMTEVGKSATTSSPSSSFNTTRMAMDASFRSARQPGRGYMTRKGARWKKLFFRRCCMNCEVLVRPVDDFLLYCSESCRVKDQPAASTAAVSTGHASSQYLGSSLKPRRTHLLGGLSQCHTHSQGNGNEAFDAGM
ncbi:hypothetical protein B0T26DRAFT_297001 [Lasiosphaeria miniovina]|uniref:Uncharacterized protein n=1 Tax=Lasiosphaeria miniovina TaxID=1954250 RepID=A0AA40AKF3_9PEZI|nr:uncharacterized protein B0T26DRAFT_297001 [Lasiosphaeria miniovina]KAK0717445.1 hypothetical protein B0T26DRAFT_297001 [Lasiosphaeria miniovina]